MRIQSLNFFSLKFSNLGLCYLLFIPISIFKTLLTSSYLGHFRIFGLPIFYIPILLVGIYFFIRRPYLSKQLLPLIIFALLGFFNVSFVQDVKQWIPYALMPFVYIIFASGLSKLNIKYHSDLVFVFLIIFSLFPIISPFLYVLNLNQYSFSPFSSLGINRNHMSIAYSFFSIFCLAKLFVNRSYMLPFIIFTLGTLLTFSRATYAYIIFSIIICLIISYWQGMWSLKFSRHIKKISVISFSIFALFLIYIFISGYGEAVLRRLGQIGEIPTILNFEEAIDYQLSGGRKQLLMRGSLALFSDYPLFGVGAGQSWLNLPEFVTELDRGGSSHTLILRILAEYGFVGFSMIFFFYINLSRLLLLRLSNMPYQLKPLSIACTSLFISIPIIALGSEYPLTSPLFWYLYSLSISISFVNNSKLTST